MRRFSALCVIVAACSEPTFSSRAGLGILKDYTPLSISVGDVISVTSFVDADVMSGDVVNRGRVSLVGFVAHDGAEGLCSIVADPRESVVLLDSGVTQGSSWIGIRGELNRSPRRERVELRADGSLEMRPQSLPETCEQVVGRVGDDLIALCGGGAKQRNISRIDAQGNNTRFFPLSAEPSGVALGSNGEVFISTAGELIRFSDVETQRVPITDERVIAAGNGFVTFGVNQVSKWSSLLAREWSAPTSGTSATLAANGEVFVGGYVDGRIDKIDAFGKAAWTITLWDGSVSALALNGGALFVAGAATDTSVDLSDRSLRKYPTTIMVAKLDASTGQVAWTRELGACKAAQ